VENTDPRIPDSNEVRIMRGLFFVHLYGAFEYALDQSFIRVAQHISTHPVTFKHMEKVIYSVAMDEIFDSIKSTSDWKKKFPKRIEVFERMSAQLSTTIRDNVLSEGMSSLNTAVITLAFRIYGIKNDPLVDPAVGGYINEVFERRCAVAHGRESPLVVGIKRTPELRKRYNALYSQAIYVTDKLSDFISEKKFVSSRHRLRYSSANNS
jgi:hypothetical protein